MPRGAASNGQVQPKRPASAFMIFSKTFHEDYKKKHAGKYDVKEAAKLAGAAWGRLSDSQKRPYQDQYVKAKARFEKEMANYDGPIVRKTKKGAKAKRVKDPNAPKRPMSSYLLFANDQRANVKNRFPNMEMKEITSELARLWREADQKTKTKYEKLAQDAKAKYMKEVDRYKARGDSPKKSPAKGRK